MIKSGERLIDIIETAASPPARFPVLVSNPGTSLEHLGRELVTALGTMTLRTASDTLPGEQGRLLLGRSADDDFVIDDPSVSRRHAALVRLGDGWCLLDLDSTNGTFVDGVRLKPRTPAALGGELVSLRFGQAAYAFMSEPSFKDYALSLKGELVARRRRPTRPISLPTTSQATWAPPDELAGARILDALRARRETARAYRVHLEDGSTHELDDWHELVSFVEANASAIVRLDGIGWYGERFPAYVRAKGS